MDTDNLIAYSRARFDHAVAKRTLKEKYQSKMIFGLNGGMFRSTPEMIAFLNLYGNEKIVVLDLYENPIEVNANELCLLMKTNLQEHMTAWLVEYQELSKNR